MNFPSGVISLLLIAAAAAMSVACAPEKKVNTVAGVKSSWNWQSHPLADTLPVARVDTRILAEQSTRFYAPNNGRLQVMIDRASGPQEKDKVWAVFSPESLKLGEEMLEARRAALKLRWETLSQVDIPQKRLEIEKKLREAKRLQEITKRLGADEQAWRTLAELMPEAGLDSADRTPAVIDRTVAILEQQLAFLSGEKGGGASQELQVAEVELRQAEIEQELKRTQYEMRMPFSGELVCNLELRDGVTDYPVANGQLIGVARKEDQLTCEVRMQDSRWLAMPPEALFLRLRLANGTELRLPYAGRRIREEMRVEVLNYVFSVPASGVASLRRNIDSVVAADLALQLERPARIVPKVALLTAYPQAFSTADWAGGVEVIWPGATTAAAGTSFVAIEPDGAKAQ
jgi:xanthine/CO dehydrogenase XdhC/CoxF family maturation factor